MKTKTFSVAQIRKDVRAITLKEGMSIHKLAKESEVEWAVLKRFITDERSGISVSTLEKLWPFIYGDRCLMVGMSNGKPNGTPIFCATDN